MTNTKPGLAERLRNDDKTAIDEIFTLYHNRIFRFSVAYLKNDNDAYDIVQDVFIKLWESRFALHVDTNFDAFIFTIAKNTVLSLFRKRLSEQKYLDYLSENFSSDSYDTEEQTNYAFLLQKYEQIVATLPLKRKEIFRMSRDLGLTNKEIALRQGISEKTVEDHITKALVYLKMQLKSYGIWTLLFYFMFVD